MGKPFLSRYYRLVIGFPRSIAIIAENNEGVIRGFAVGFCDDAGFYKHMKSHWLFLAPSVVLALIRNPLLLRKILYSRLRVGRMSRGFRDPFSVELASIAADEKGGGVGSALLKDFAREARTMGGRSIRLTTDLEDNVRTLSFYRKHGFVQTGTELRDGRPMGTLELNLI
jgi:GNAT superfamily N-acetyltransferase